MYRSQALIQVVPPQVPESIVRSVSNGNFLDRLSATQQTILSRTRLERVINEFNLYQEERKRLIMEEVVENMRNDIKVTPQKGDTFRIEYIGRSPVTVMKVTEKLASYFRDEPGRRRAARRGTNSFVEAQVEEEAQLKAVEDRLTSTRSSTPANCRSRRATSKRSGRSAEPEQLTANIAAARTSRACSSTRSRLKSRAARSRPPCRWPAPIRNGRQRSASLAKQRFRLPDQRHARNASHMRRSRRLSRSSQEVNDSAQESVGAGVGLSRKNRLVSAAGQFTRNSVDQANIVKCDAEQKRLERLQRAIRRSSTAFHSAKRNEEMTREYTRLHYRQLSSGDIGSVGQPGAAADRQQFNLLDRPCRETVQSGPLMHQPVRFPRRSRVRLALVALLEYRDSTFRTDHEVSSVLSLPVLAVVPLMRSAGEKRAAFRRKLILNVGLGSTVMVGLAVLAYALVR
jgi:hypothetical protein